MNNAWHECDFTVDWLHSKGPRGPSDYIGYISVTERNDPALVTFDAPTVYEGP